MLLGLDVSCPNGEIVQKAMEKGLVLLTAGSNVVRMAPPLVIKKEHLDECCHILDEILSEMS